MARRSYSSPIMLMASRRRGMSCSMIRELGLFLMRVEWDLSDFALEVKEFGQRFAPIAEALGRRWRLELSSVRPRLAIFVSHYDHCLADLLYRHRSGELACDLPLIISNH